MRGAVLRAGWALAALPLAVAGAVLALLRRGGAADAVLLAPLRRLTPGAVPRGRLGRYAAAALPTGAVTSAVAAYAWAILVLNLGYPLRPDVGEEPLEGAWGGPSIEGAWAVHAAGGLLVFALVGLPLLWLLTSLHVRLARRLVH